MDSDSHAGAPIGGGPPAFDGHAVGGAQAAGKFRMHAIRDVESNRRVGGDSQFRHQGKTVSS